MDSTPTILDTPKSSNVISYDQFVKTKSIQKSAVVSPRGNCSSCGKDLSLKYLKAKGGKCMTCNRDPEQFEECAKCKNKTSKNVLKNHDGICGACFRIEQMNNSKTKCPTCDNMRTPRSLPAGSTKCSYCLSKEQNKSKVKCNTCDSVFTLKTLKKYDGKCYSCSKTHPSSPSSPTTNSEE